MLAVLAQVGGPLGLGREDLLRMNSHIRSQASWAAESEKSSQLLSLRRSRPSAAIRSISALRSPKSWPPMVRPHPRLDALHDHRELEMRERPEPVRSPRSAPVRLAYRSAMSERGGNPGSAGTTEGPASDPGLTPVEQEHAEIGERITEVASSQSSTAATGRRRPRRRCSCRSGSRRGRWPPRAGRAVPPAAGGRVRPRRDVPARGALPLSTPPPDLPLDEAVGTAEIGQADRRRVDGVQFGQAVGERVAPRRSAPAPRTRPAGRPGRPPVYLGHDVTGDAQQVAAFVQDDLGDGHGRLSERPLDPDLAVHVVRGRQYGPAGGRRRTSSPAGLRSR